MADTPRPLAANDTIWFFDPNQRRYPRHPDGSSMSGPPTFRGHFRAIRITQITPRTVKLSEPCWLYGRTITSLPRDRAKWPRVTTSAVGGFFVVGQDEVDAICWLAANVRGIADAVRKETNIELLKTIGRMLGVPEVAEHPLTGARTR